MPDFLKLTTPKWYNYEQIGDTAILRVDGIVGGSFCDVECVNAKEFVDTLQKINTSRIELHINSPGGDVFAGYTIYNALTAWSRAVPGRSIAVIVDGLAASIASVIAMAGDSIAMPEASLLMIHNPWCMTVGDAAEHRKSAEQLDTIAEQLANVYASRTGLTAAECREMMNAETYISAEDALRMGFATEIIENKQAIAACAAAAEIYGSNVPNEILKIGLALQKRKNEKRLRDAGVSRSRAKLQTSTQRDADVKSLHSEIMKMFKN